jgi:Tfp pilus assembly protein PilP
MNLTRKFGFIIIFMAAIFLLFACDQGKPFKDLHAYIDKLKLTSVKKEDLASVKPVNQLQPASVKYQAQVRRSPFEVLEAAPVKGSTTNNPLHSYPLDMLRFVGTVTQNGSTIAFVSAPDNKIYQVKVGDVLGDRSSQILTIDADTISLTEQYSDNGSVPMKRVVTLQLKENSQ